MKKNYKQSTSNNKRQRAIDAQRWLDTLEQKWSKEVGKAVTSTSVYRSINHWSFDIQDERYEHTVTKIFNNDVITCAKAAVTHAEKGSKVLVLNFASFTNPGGGFLKGSMAQEESICHSSGLYPCLKSKMNFYEENRTFSTDNCYRNDYIYSEDVPVIVNNKCYLIDILTMAAPNKNASKHSPIEIIFEERMECAFLVGIEKKVDIILLGAWGCGVFGNDPKFVAETWKELTREYDGRYKGVIHPILDKGMCKVSEDVYSNK